MNLRVFRAEPCDVVIAGGGTGGVMAALAVSRSGVERLPAA